MKPICFLVLTLILAVSASAQFFYKDILATNDLMRKHQDYRKNAVKAVDYASFDATDKPIEGFSCQQTVSPDFSSIKTVTKTTLAGVSESMSLYNTKGQLVRTTDTADGNKTNTDYTYDAAGRIVTITSFSLSPGQATNEEQHRWFYNQQGKPEKALKIKNGIDTTYISFVLDEKGNIAEERSTRKNVALPTIYYYYDEDNFLTDIVRYNTRVRKLLPDYVFEYEDRRVATMLITEEGTGDYQKWYYSYDDNGLKLQDACYSKSKTLIGRIEYTYRF
jgi:YD repeat-containing protein